MKKSRLLGAVCACLAIQSFNVGAALIDNGTYTTDDVSKLNWLDLSITDGQSYNQALTSNPGWRYATNAEVENLFSVAFDGYYDTDPARVSNSSTGYADQDADVAAFRTLFGCTFVDVGECKTYGTYLDEDNILRLMGTWDRGVNNTRIFSTEYGLTLDTATQYSVSA